MFAVYSGLKSVVNCVTRVRLVWRSVWWLYVTHKLLWCYVQILTLQKPHISASFNMYLIINKWVIAVKVSKFSGQYLGNHRTLDIGVLGYVGIVWPKEHSPEVRSFPPVTPCIYTGWPRRNVPDFGKVFLMLKYTDITQNTYVQIWMVTKIKAREKWDLLAVPRTVPGSRDVIPIRWALSILVYSRLKRVLRCDCTCKVLGNRKDNYDISASVFVVQFNGFMSLTI